MSVAVLADVHGNVHALEACLFEVAQAGIDLIVLGGDTVAGPFPGRTLDALRAASIEVRAVRGNAESDVLRAVARPWGRDVDDVWTARDLWVAQRLTDRDLGYLKTFETTVHLRPAGLGRVCVCHGSPRDEAEILTPLTPDADVEAAIATADADIVIGGHIHVQYDRRLGSGRRIMNAGSVGMPYEESPGAYWALIDDGTVSLRRTSYDVDAACQEMTATDFPDASGYARMIASPPGRREAIETFESRRP